MKTGELKKWMEENVVVRPYNEKGEKDGNYNYIHRTRVAELISELRADSIVINIKNGDMSEYRAALLAKFLAEG